MELKKALVHCVRNPAIPPFLWSPKVWISKGNCTFINKIRQFCKEGSEDLIATKPLMTHVVNVLACKLMDITDIFNDSIYLYLVELLLEIPVFESFVCIRSLLQSKVV